MAARVSLTSECDTQGHSMVVVHKAALSGDRRDRQGEARWLTACRANTATADLVPQVLRVTDQPFITIVLARVPGETLRTSRLTPNAMLPVLRSVIEGVIRLHDHGMVHGNLSLDHVICGPDGVVLISPLGHAQDPQDDQRALATMIHSLLQRWADWGVTVSERDQWVALANRLGDEDQPLPLRRSLRLLDSLLPAQGRSRQRFPSGGVTLITAAVSLFLIGLLFDIGSHDDVARAADDAESEQRDASQTELIETAPEILWEGHRYRVGRPGDIAVAGANRCHHQPAVILLEPETGQLWAFAHPADGESGALLSPTSDAIDLEIRPGIACPEFLAITTEGDTVVLSS